MQKLFQIPEPLAARFRQAVPPGQRSAFVTKLIEKALPEADEPLHLIALEAEKDAALNAEMQEWRDGLIADGIRGEGDVKGEQDAMRWDRTGH